MAKRTKQTKKRIPIAMTADRHRLYELSVQHAPSEIDFIDKQFRKMRGHRAKVLREDFCGTANVCCEWVRLRKKNRAIGVDIDPEVLLWGKTNNLIHLSKSKRKRITLVCDDVLKAKTETPDIVSAMNFSYWLLKKRSLLKKYFRQVHATLAKDGVFFLDCYGGYDSFREITEEREIEDENFTYIWEQERFNPVNHEVTCAIHFAFEDGSRMDRAFHYTWRLWTLPEIKDLLKESGFSQITVYWQGWDKDGEPDGIFKPAKEGDADAGWICYISAEK